MTDLIRMTMLARALDMPVDPHPNRMPFSGVLTRIDEPSDAAPEGSNGKQVMLTKAVADRALTSLLGMGVNYNPDGHSPREKVGVIDEAKIEANSIWVKGYIFAADFPEVAAEIKANKNVLGMSFEAQTLLAKDVGDDHIKIDECIFTGAAILLKDKAAYRTTSILAHADHILQSINKGNAMFDQIVLTPMQAASDPRNLPLLKTVKMQAQRCGFRIEGDKQINLIDLDDAMRRANVSIESRMNLKSMLYQLRLIPA